MSTKTKVGMAVALAASMLVSSTAATTCPFVDIPAGHKEVVSGGNCFQDDTWAYRSSSLDVDFADKQVSSTGNWIWRNAFTENVGSGCSDFVG